MLAVCSVIIIQLSSDLYGRIGKRKRLIYKNNPPSGRRSVTSELVDHVMSHLVRSQPFAPSIFLMENWIPQVSREADQAFYSDRSSSQESRGMVFDEKWLEPRYMQKDPLVERKNVLFGRSVIFGHIRIRQCYENKVQYVMKFCHKLATNKYFFMMSHMFLCLYQILFLALAMIFTFHGQNIKDI